jgi:hypothetical protein
VTLLHPCPLGLGADALNRAPCNAEVGGYKPVYSTIDPNGSNIAFGQSGLPLTFSAIAGAVYRSVRLIFCPCHPPKIGERRIPWVAIKVSRLVFWRPRPDECFKNKDMDIALAACAKLNNSVSPYGLLRDQSMPGAAPDNLLAPSSFVSNFARFAAHISKVGNGVPGRPTTGSHCSGVALLSIIAL